MKLPFLAGLLIGTLTIACNVQGPPVAKPAEEKTTSDYVLENSAHLEMGNLQAVCNKKRGDLVYVATSFTNSAALAVAVVPGGCDDDSRH